MGSRPIAILSIVIMEAAVLFLRIKIREAPIVQTVFGLCFDKPNMQGART